MAASDGGAGANFETLAVHAGYDPGLHNGAMSAPIYQTSNFARQVEPGTGWDYSRLANPTRAALEARLAALEDGATGVAFASGMAAAATLLQTLCSSGARVIVPTSVYSGVWDLLDQVYPRWGLTHTAVDMTDPAALAAALRPETALVWLESPSNPLLRLTDIPAAARVAHRAGALVVVDSTFASPYLQRPLALGADVVLHSTTKYLSGHGDVTGGALVAADPAIGERLDRHTAMLGGMASPFEAWLTLRGVQTLPARMRQICASAERIAAFLHGHPAVAATHYPTLPGHPDHELALEQMPHGCGGVVSAELRAAPEAVAEVCARTRLFTLAVSLGGTESLIEQPARMSHRSTGGSPHAVPPSLIRLAVGLEDADELIRDLDRALAGLA